MTKLDAGLMTSLPASDPGSAAVLKIYEVFSIKKPKFFILFPKILVFNSKRVSLLLSNKLFKKKHYARYSSKSRQKIRETLHTPLFIPVQSVVAVIVQQTKGAFSLTKLLLTELLNIYLH